jgi:hypothetical protein
MIRDQRGNPVLVEDTAGHANRLITLNRYSHLLDTRVTEAAERFDPARTA